MRLCPSADITHSLKCVLEYQSDHDQWAHQGGGSGSMRPEVQALESHQHTLFRHLKNEYFSRNLGQNMPKNAYFLEKKL